MLVISFLFAIVSVGTRSLGLTTEIIFEASSILGSLDFAVKEARFWGVSGRTPAHTPKSGYLSRQIPKSHSRFFKKIEDRLYNTEKGLKGSLFSCLAVILLTIAYLPRIGRADQFNPNVFPVKAVDWLVAHPQQGNMFNNFAWGGYLLYRLWPEQSVFIDGQTDFYGEPLTREYSKVITLENGWQEILHKYDVSWMIVQPGLPVVKALQEEKGWNTVYLDDTTVILRKP